MQYILIDTHKRMVGMVNSRETLHVGDTVRSPNAQLLTVIGMDWSEQLGTETHALTVIPTHKSEVRIINELTELVMEA